MTEDHTGVSLEESIANKKIAVLGTGLYGRALVTRLVSTRRYEVAHGSRNPDAQQVTRQEAVRDASIVFLAVPVSAHADVVAAVHDDFKKGVVVVDISNHPLTSKFRGQTVSNAEALQKLVPPGIHVVKAFNNLASYDLDAGGTGTGVSKRMPVVHIAGDEESAVMRMSTAVSAMGMIPVAHGPLSSARELEALPHRLFPTWRFPAIVSIVVFAWWLLYVSSLFSFCTFGWPLGIEFDHMFQHLYARVYVLIPRVSKGPDIHFFSCFLCSTDIFVIVLPSYSLLSTYVIHGRRGEPSRPMSKYPLSSFMASTGETAITLFALTFLAGPLALIAQVVRGDVSKPFGKFFGLWLGIRKELGMVAFAFMAAHGIAGAVSASHLEDGWKGQAYFVAGIVSFVGFSVLAASSDASVSSAMSWAEFRAIFGFLGAFSLAAGVLHQGMWGWIIKKHIPSPSFWVGGGKVMPIYWLGIILPLFTLLMRLISWSPCISFPQRKLRGETYDGPHLED